MAGADRLAEHGAIQKEIDMQFEEVDAGDFRIYAGALERRGGGYCAAVVVVRQRADGRREEVFRDEDIGAGYPWPNGEEALRYAVQRGQDIVMTRTDLLARAAATPAAPHGGLRA
jgi:hypothetical protein